MRCSNSAKKHTFKSYPSICVTVGSTMEERTLILIKPEGVQQGLLAIVNSKLGTQKGLKLVATKTVQDIDDSLKKKWNAQHSSVLDKIDSGPVIALVYQGLDAVNEARIELGDINVKDAFFRSEDQETAEQEIALWFAEEDMLLAKPVQKIESNISPKERKSTVEGWHDLFIKCPHIADHIFSQMNLEEILQICEVCEDWDQAVQNSKKVQDRLSVNLHKAAVEGWLRVAKLHLDRGADPNQRIVCDEPCLNSCDCGKEWRLCEVCKRKHYYRDIRNMALSWTPLHGAVVMRRPEMTKLLRSRGAKSKGVDSELRFYNYEEPGNPCIHIVTPIQLSSTFWRPEENANDRHLVHDVLLGRRTESNYYSPSTPHSHLRYCHRCDWSRVPDIVWCFRNFDSHSTKDCLVKRFNLQ